MDVAGKAQTLAAALNHSAFNVANALGPWLGGIAIAHGAGLASTGLVGRAWLCRACDLGCGANALKDKASIAAPPRCAV